MSAQSAHRGIIHTIRHKLATWLHEPTETPWQRFRNWGYEAPVQPAPAPVQATGPISVIDGIAGGQPIEWPIGMYSAVATGRLPHVGRETAIAVQPSSVQLIAFTPTSSVGRAALFADVVSAPPAENEENESDDGKTKMRTDPAMYRLQQMARARQKEEVNYANN